MCFTLGDWITVFHASSGIQRSVYDLWNGPQSMFESGWTGNLAKPYQKATSHYKSYLVEQWQQLKIMQVQIIKDNLYLLNRKKVY